MKNYNTVLTEKQQTYQHYDQVKLIKLPSDQSRIIEHVIHFENQIKAIEDQGIKQVEALKALKPEENQELESIAGLFPKQMRNNEIKNEINEMKNGRKDLRYKTSKYTYDFKQYKTTRSFGDNIYTSKITIDVVEMD